MLHHVLIILLAWCPLSLTVALLVGASCKLREPHPMGFRASLETDFETNGGAQFEEDDMRVCLPTFHIQ